MLESFLSLPFLADENSSFWFPPSASGFSEEVDGTYDMILWICLAFFVVIAWCMFYFAYRYHQPKGGKATSRASHNNVLEISWSIGPSILLVLMFVRGTWAYLDMKEAPADAMTVDATAKKWSWLFTYPGGVSHPELHVVKGRGTKVTMRSQDVLHAFFIPAFRCKQDVVPGRYNTIWFLPTIANEKVSPAELEAAKKENNGESFDLKKSKITDHGYTFFDLYCAEYCGDDHSKMQTVVVVHETQADFEEWLQLANVKPKDKTPEQYGQLMYEQRGCKSCHTLDGKAGTGPTFKGQFGSERKLTDGSAVVMDENYIKESILNPRAKVVAGFQPVMPAFKGQLTDEQVDCIIAFIKSLK